jgi:hypothetical protein
MRHASRLKLGLWPACCRKQTKLNCAAAPDHGLHMHRTPFYCADARQGSSAVPYSPYLQPLPLVVVLWSDPSAADISSQAKAASAHNNTRPARSVAPAPAPAPAPPVAKRVNELLPVSRRRIAARPTPRSRPGRTEYICPVCRRRCQVIVCDVKCNTATIDTVICWDR